MIAEAAGFGLFFSTSAPEPFVQSPLSSWHLSPSTTQSVNPQSFCAMIQPLIPLKPVRSNQMECLLAEQPRGWKGMKGSVAEELNDGMPERLYGVLDRLRGKGQMVDLSIV